MYVRQFYNLIPYEKAKEMIVDIGKEVDQYKAYKVKKALVNLMKHIAHGQAVEMYPVMQKYQFKQAIKTIYIVEKEVKSLEISEAKKIDYLGKLNEIRKIIITLSKKIKVEE